MTTSESEFTGLKDFIDNKQLFLKMSTEPITFPYRLSDTNQELKI